ncbi:xanthine dehydrogenase accessory protein XdhC [Pusillimonas sp. T2]|uniref:xanthine dehydrogenase accessory protein XdhC n=1 Tax=Pusillimonas sp. T2 TaxID=1548123 RepID=UPI000B9D44BB|nr:xanthine dehydrogenase accessory protein XdhC [Pusillimonas sp. T2]OXR48497.1 xanthine dehydrogenase accessory protein XdhC [Pusillimonas sp. T2]
MADAGGWSLAARQALQAGRSLVLVTVVQSAGSAPRGGGAKLWVLDNEVLGTIGGGHLEFKAIDFARSQLSDPSLPARHIERYALGPSLGQCCGGVVWLGFERLGPEDLPWFDRVAGYLSKGLSVRRIVSFTDLAAPVSLQSSPEPAQDFDTDQAYWDADSGRLTDVLSAASLTVVVCGAGHVGRAIVNILGTLPVRVIWLDPRDDVWPAALPANVTVLQGDDGDVADCPDNACWLVLTHSHALDMALVQAVMAQKTFRFLGLIGSATKKARFESRLRQHFPEAMVAQMTCPIGLVKTNSKLPEVIAVSVVAQLLSLT